MSGILESIIDKQGYKEKTTATAPQNAYVRLFTNLSALIDASDLKLTFGATSANSYGHLFDGCTNLVSGPDIYATTWANYALEYMFQNNTSLSSAKIRITGSYWGAIGSTQRWMNGVPGTGTFYYNGTSTTRGVSNIPTGWTVTPFS